MSDFPENAPDHCPGTKSDEAGKASACAGCPNQNLCASEATKGPDPDCPGTKSDEAGKASACAGCPNQNLCASEATKGPDPDEGPIAERLSSINRKIIVLSGKGGVGKSTFAAMLSRVIASNEENEVGVLDVDICGPSQPRLLGASSESVHSSGSGWSPVYVSENLSLMSIGFLLSSPEDAVIWRGPKKNGMIKQFLKDVDWRDLNYLVIDTPPGTSDEHLSLVKYVAPSPNTGAVIVTTPQEVALQDVRKEITFCKKVNLPIIGIVENMTTFVCPKCNFESTIFPPTTGGARSLSEEFDIPFLGGLALDPKVAKACDEGVNLISEAPDLAVCKAYQQITQKIMDHFQKTTQDSGQNITKIKIK